jgi:hypothetical protein
MTSHIVNALITAQVPMEPTKYTEFGFGARVKVQSDPKIPQRVSKSVRMKSPQLLGNYKP